MWVCVGKREDASPVPMCDIHHNRFAARIARLTLHVICCRGPAQNPFSVTLCSRLLGEYRPVLRDSVRCLRQQDSGFWRSAIRSSWIPPVPETAGRQIYQHKAPRPPAAGPCLLGFGGSADRAKDDGTPRGAVLLPFPVRNRTPVRSISARVVAQRLPVKVLMVISREHASYADQPAKY